MSVMGLPSYQSLRQSQLTQRITQAGHELRPFGVPGEHAADRETRLQLEQTRGNRLCLVDTAEPGKGRCQQVHGDAEPWIRLRSPARSVCRSRPLPGKKVRIGKSDIGKIDQGVVWAEADGYPGMCDGGGSVASVGADHGTKSKSKCR